MAGPSFRPKRGTPGFGEIIESVLAQQLIQASVEGVARRRRQSRCRDPHRRLPVTFAHRHARSVVRMITTVDPSGLGG